MTDPTKQPDRTTPDLDALLRQWHDVNAGRAADGRDLLVRRLREQRRAERARAERPGPVAAVALFAQRLLVNRYTPALASLMFLVVIVALLVPRPGATAHAAVAMVAEGGRLEAIDDEGNMLGACPLAHTDVDARVSGFMSRVDVTQTYTNPYDKKIEAIYTFPLSHRAAVDRMTITVGDRLVEGEVKERDLARQIYEAARAQGYVAGLLEQQRPNIFTQSIANIEPGAEVVVRISYVEMLEGRDGTYTFDFPMVVGPRYIPGAPMTSPSVVPAELESRAGLILLGPATLIVGAAGDTTPGTLQPGKLAELIGAAQPVHYPGDTWWGRGGVTGGAGSPDLWYRFEAAYADGSKEFGALYTDGTGQINGRWFYADRDAIKGMGTGFARDTNQVPDASLITPMPVKPPTRAGHDVSVTVTIDSGGPGLVDVASELHEIRTATRDLRDDGTPAAVTVTLADKDTIPNRDFVLSWRQTADAIQEATFTHTIDSAGDWSGGFFTLVLQPPDRVADAHVPPRELIFVMDTSGSMDGFPLEQSKAVMTRAIDAMRPADTFNVITFAGYTAVLWNKPQPATPENRAAAQTFIATQQGGGGTEMMQAIKAALVPVHPPGPLSPQALLNLPADGRRVELAVPYSDVHVTERDDAYRIPVADDLFVPVHFAGDLPEVFSPHGVTLRFTGQWVTGGGRRVLLAESVSAGGAGETRPMRLVVFLTDGYVGNDQAIIDAVRSSAHTTRVFPFGIGDSVNRYLIDGMAKAGRGEAEVVLLNADAGEAVERFTRRIETPVLTDITLAFSDGLHVTDMLPAPDAIPDLFDVEPLVIHGRYAEPGRGTVTIRGRTGAGPYERVVELDLPETAPEHDVIATLWARAKVDDVLETHLRQLADNATPQPVKDDVVALGEQFSIMTPFTSFVAVEKSRMTIDGEPVLVAVPIELPEGVKWEGVFGGEVDERNRNLVPMLGDIPTMQGFFTPSVPQSVDAPGEFETRMGRSEVSAGARMKRSAPGKGGGGFGAAGGPAAPAPRSDVALRDAVVGGQSVERQSGQSPSPEKDASLSSAGRTMMKSNEAGNEAREVLQEAAQPPAELGVKLDAGAATASSYGFDRNAGDAVRRGLAADEEAAAADDRVPRIHRVLDPALLALIADRDKAEADDLKNTRGDLLVTVLVDGVSDTAVRDALSKAGLTIKGFSKSLPIVVGTVAPEDLEKLALVPGVRLIEPARVSRDRVAR